MLNKNFTSCQKSYKSLKLTHLLYTSLEKNRDKFWAIFIMLIINTKNIY